MLLRTMNKSRNFRTIRLRRLVAHFGLRLLGCAAFFVFAAGTRAQAPPLLVMISVDGMRPDYITEADAHGAKIPNLRRFLKEGTYAEGVVGVVPTVTYPEPHDASDRRLAGEARDIRQHYV